MNYSEIELRGNKYRKYNKNWVDEGFAIVSPQLQRQLNILSKKNESDEKVNKYDQLKSTADVYKKLGRVERALEIYLDILDKTNELEMGYLLPRITSCYRMLGEPKNALLIYEKYGYMAEKVYSVALYTSIAAAYCDLCMINKANEMIALALNMNFGVITAELNNVILRIDSLNTCYM